MSSPPPNNHLDKATDKMIEAAARKMAMIEGQNPDERASRFHDGLIWQEYKISAHAILEAALAEAGPVAWRVKDFADGWILCHSLEDARREAAGAGNLIQPLILGVPNEAAAEIERLTRDLAEARQDFRIVYRAGLAAIAESRRQALADAAQLIEEGFDRGIKRKQDTCAHGKFEWEDCDRCCAAAIRDKAAMEEQ